MLVADPDLKLPRTYQWNVALEQSIGNNQSISADLRWREWKAFASSNKSIQCESEFSISIALTDNSATSDYHALQVKFERRLSRGLQALASYSWSHSIDIASTDAIATNINTPDQVADPNVDRGNSNFDIRHAVTAGVTL